MKKKWSLIAAAAAALALAGCMLAGCGSNDAAKDSANSDTTKLIVGFDQSYPPYGFVGNDGNYTGFDLDLATEVATTLLVLTLILLRKLPTVTVGTSSFLPSIGIPRMLS